MKDKILLKQNFLNELKAFVAFLPKEISLNGEWTMRGVIDISKNVYPLPPDTKVISKIFELHLLPHLLNFAKIFKFRLEPAEHQNWYPDLTFISKRDSTVKFAVDLKTTYRDENNPGFCNGFTLGSHGEYFADRTSSKTTRTAAIKLCRLLKNFSSSKACLWN